MIELEDADGNDVLRNIKDVCVPLVSLDMNDSGKFRAIQSAKMDLQI